MNEPNNSWHVEFNGTFFDVLPDEDSKEHFIGDECWCYPNVERSIRSHPMFKGTPFEITELHQPVIVHHSHDGRERPKSAVQTTHFG